MSKKSLFLPFYRYLLTLSVVLCVAVGMQYPSEGVTVAFCDVGQGDAILLSYQSTQLLIDAGPGEEVLVCLEEALPYWDKTIEFAIATHPDLDHIGGFPLVAEHYFLQKMLYLPLEPESKVSYRFYEMLANIQSEGAVLLIPTRGERYRVGSLISFEVISPFLPLRLEKGCEKSIAETYLWDKNGCFFNRKKGSLIDKNNLSIGIKLEIGPVVFLMMADLEEEAEMAMLRSQMLHRVNVLKVGHHGSKSSTTQPFIEVTRPEVSVVSVGKNNAYNHPAPQVVQRLEDIGSTVLRTDTLGTVEFLVQGDVFWSKNHSYYWK